MNTSSSGGRKAAHVWKTKGEEWAKAAQSRPKCEYCGSMRTEPGYRACSACRGKIRSAIREDYSSGMRDLGRREAT